MDYFEYGERETDYLKSKDPRLAEVIEKIGHIDRPVDEDLFSSVVHQILGQQISNKALDTIWGRMQEKYGSVDAEHIAAAECGGAAILRYDISQGRVH